MWVSIESLELACTRSFTRHKSSMCEKICKKQGEDKKGKNEENDKTLMQPGFHLVQLPLHIWGWWSNPAKLSILPRKLHGSPFLSLQKYFIWICANVLKAARQKPNWQQPTIQSEGEHHNQQCPTRGTTQQGNTTTKNVQKEEHDNQQCNVHPRSTFGRSCACSVWRGGCWISLS